MAVAAEKLMHSNPAILCPRGCYRLRLQLEKHQALARIVDRSKGRNSGSSFLFLDAQRHKLYVFSYFRQVPSDLVSIKSVHLLLLPVCFCVCVGVLPPRRRPGLLLLPLLAPPLSLLLLRRRLLQTSCQATATTCPTTTMTTTTTKWSARAS